MSGLAWQEVEVHVGWGALRGKTCVVGDVPPHARLVVVHDLLDNANSFDALVPLLPAGVEVLALDLPGHGLSDHLPLGAHYNSLVHVYNLRRALVDLGWTKCILMGHGYGAQICITFTAIFPQHVKGLINLDFIQTKNDKRVNKWRSDVFGTYKNEQEKTGSPAVFTEEQAMSSILAGRNKGGKNIGLEAAKMLMPRATRKTEQGHVFTHDPKVRHSFNSVFGGSLWVEIVSAVSCPVLLLVAAHGTCAPPPARYRDVMNAYRVNSARLSYAMVGGGHHAHLTHPHTLAPHLTRFLAQVFTHSQPARL